MERSTYSIDVGGKTMTASFSNLAAQANGSVLVSMGNTVVLATAVLAKEKRPGVDYFPLTVDYEERFYASGELLGSRYFRREGKPSDTAILSGRMIDRALRPLFDHRMRNDVQIIVTVLSIGEDDPDILALNAASLALCVSDIPWQGPVVAVRVAAAHGSADFEINPVIQKEESFALTLVAAGKDGAINMLEGAARETDEGTVGLALRRAGKEIARLEKFQKEISQKIGKKKQDFSYPELSADARALFEKEIAPALDAAVFSGAPGWGAITALEERFMALVLEQFPREPRALITEYFDAAVNKALHDGGLSRGKRADGRTFDEVRSLFAQAGGISETLHGSGIFYRGETHVLSVLTLGSPHSAQSIDGVEEKREKRFMHHYNFPPFSAGQTGKIGSANRREVGHGALAERALAAVLPDDKTFPYAIRLVAESLSSNGSTSMASVCAGSLALMDGGVPITRPVAGIAIGLLYANEKNYRLLSDIQGPEDHHGDMDFKVAGTETGITAIQLDVKVESVPVAVLEAALVSAAQARAVVLAAMERALPAPSRSLNPHAPRVHVKKIPQEKIGSLIGPGGKTIKAIRAESGVREANIENDGTLMLVGSEESVARAWQKIEAVLREPEHGGERRRFENDRA